jgi:hypothetical protein
MAWPRQVQQLSSSCIWHIARRALPSVCNAYVPFSTQVWHEPSGARVCADVQVWFCVTVQAPDLLPSGVQPGQSLLGLAPSVPRVMIAV